MERRAASEEQYREPNAQRPMIRRYAWHVVVCSSDDIDRESDVNGILLCCYTDDEVWLFAMEAQSSGTPYRVAQVQALGTWTVPDWAHAAVVIRLVSTVLHHVQCFMVNDRVVASTLLISSFNFSKSWLWSACLVHGLDTA